MRIMYGEENMARERIKEGAKVAPKRKKRSHLHNEKKRTWYAKAKVMAGTPANSERDEEAQAHEEGERQPAQDKEEASEVPRIEPEEASE